MSLIMLELANERIADAHREAELRRSRRRLVIEQRQARRARRAVSRRRGPSPLVLLLRGATAPRR